MTSHKQATHQHDHLISQSIHALVNAGNTGDEIQLLQSVIEILVKNDRSNVLLEDSFSDTSDLRQFVSYALNRRFGWSENKTSTLLEHKQSLNNLLDCFTQLLCNQHFTPLLCDILLSSASPTNTGTISHVVRDQTYKLLFDWIKCQHTRNDVIIIHVNHDDSDETLYDIDSDFEDNLSEHQESCKNSDQTCDSPVSPPADMPSVIRMVISGLTDVWSAIRNSCASRLVSLLETFQKLDLENLFQRLSAICNDASASWQAKEGAVLGIVSILKSFRLEPVKIFAPDQSHIVLLQLGRNRYEGLPTWLHTPIREILFPLLSHPQLTIRESAKKGLVAFHARSPRSEILITRDHLVRSLLSLPPSPSPLPELSLLPPSHPITDPYAAEGLLSVCSTVLRADAQGLFSHEDWAYHLHAYILYLAHPASTVRIEASSLFKHIVSRYADSPLVIRMVLQCLAARWHFPIPSSLLPPHTESILSPLSYTAPPDSPSSTSHSPSWEWKEGRLLAYEIVFRFLLANHTHYTQPYSHKLRRKSKTKLSFSTPNSPNSSAPSTPSTPNRPTNSQREGALARSVSLERVTLSSPILQPRSYPFLRSMSPQASLPDDQRSLRISSHALSLIEQLVEDKSDLKSSLPFATPLPLGIILQQISAQMAESFGFPRWEINRMAEQVLKPLVDTLFLLGTSVSATVSSIPSTQAPENTSSDASPSPILEPSQAQENPPNQTIPLLSLLWYSLLETQLLSPKSKPPTEPPLPTQRPIQKLHNRPHFLSHVRHHSHSSPSSDKGHSRVRSHSNPQLRLSIPIASSPPHIQFMACKSLRHALMLVSHRSHSMRPREDSFSSLPPLRPHSPNIQPLSLSLATSSSSAQPTLRPSSPNIERRQSFSAPGISSLVISHIPVILPRIISIILNLLSESSSVSASSTNDDRLVVATCELLVIVSVGEGTSTPEQVTSNVDVIGQVFQWLARLSQSRKTKLESQLLSAIHLHLIKLITRIPLSLHPSSSSELPRESDTALSLACYLVPLIPSHADPILQSSLLDAVAAALDRVPLNPPKQESDSSTEKGEEINTIDYDHLRLLCTLCTKWLVRLVAKPLEGSVMRSSLRVLHHVVLVSLAHSITPDAILAHIFKTIAQRLSPFTPHSPLSLSSSHAGLLLKTPVSNALSMHSNEIARSWDSVGDVDSDFDDAEEREVEDDDWDDEDDTTGGDVVVGECVTFLHDIHVAEPRAFGKGLHTLPPSERSVLSWALTQA